MLRGLILFAMATAAFGQSAGRHYSNKRWGYKVRAPEGWKSAALQSSEQWIGSKHLGDQKLEAKRSEFYEAGYPQMWVIGFPHGLERGAKIDEKDEKTTISIRNPYKDYKDLLKRNRGFVGGGYHFTKEEETEIKGVKVTQYEILVDKLVSAPYRITTWVFHFKDADFAVQFKILGGYHKKYRATFKACLKSFKRIKRTGVMPGTGATTGDTIITSDEDEKKLTPAERTKKRKETFERTLQKEVAALPKGWYVLRNAYYVCISNCPKRKFPKEVLNHALAIRGYLDKTFGGVGSDYIPPGIIRVFETSSEYTAYAQGTSWGGVQQVLLSEESKKTGRKSWAMERVSDGVTSQWMWFKNRNLSSNMPWWFRFGLEQHMRFARVKGKTVAIKPDDWDREQTKMIIKQNKNVHVRKLFEAGDTEQSYLMQCGSVISYMLTKGNRGKTKGIIPLYMKNMITAIEKAQGEYKKKRDEALNKASSNPGGKVEESEEESGEEETDEDFEAFKAALKEKSEAIRKDAFEATFGKLTAKDWDRLNKGWIKYAG